MVSALTGPWRGPKQSVTQTIAALTDTSWPFRRTIYANPSILFRLNYSAFSWVPWKLRKRARNNSLSASKQLGALGDRTEVKLHVIGLLWCVIVLSSKPQHLSHDRLFGCECVGHHYSTWNTFVRFFYLVFTNMTALWIKIPLSRKAIHFVHTQLRNLKYTVVKEIEIIFVCRV